MNKSILGILSILATALIYPFYVQSLVQETSVLRQDITGLNDAIIKVDNFISITNRLAEQKDEFSQIELSRLGQILPKDVSTLPLIVNIQNIALNNGLLIGGGVEVTKNSAAVSSGGSSKYDTVTLNFNIVGRYSNIKSFLDEIAGSLTLLDVSQFSFAGNEEGLYSFRIVIKTYELPDESEI